MWYKKLWALYKFRLTDLIDDRIVWIYVFLPHHPFGDVERFCNQTALASFQFDRHKITRTKIS